jgi:vacuolar-type H+-ATPase subunit I/STV1
MSCSNLSNEGKFCIGLSLILGSVLLAACMLVGLGNNETDIEQGKTLMLVGSILFLLFFIAICTWCVACFHTDSNDRSVIMGPV